MKQITIINSIFIYVHKNTNLHKYPHFEDSDSLILRLDTSCFDSCEQENSSDRASILVQRSGTCANEKRFCKRADNLH